MIRVSTHTARRDLATPCTFCTVTVRAGWIVVLDGKEVSP